MFPFKGRGYTPEKYDKQIKAYYNSLYFFSNFSQERVRGYHSIQIVSTGKEKYQFAQRALKVKVVTCISQYIM